MSLARRCYRLILAILVLAGLLILGLAVDIWRFGGQSDAGRADAALVLGAAVLGDEPSPVLVERLRHAKTLYEQGRVAHIVVTGGRSPEDALTEAQASRNWLVGAGVPADAIVIEDRSGTTLENLQFAKPIMAKQGFARVLIVSDPLHMRRAMMIADRLGVAAGPSPTPSSRYRTWNTTLPFLAREVWFAAEYLLLGR